MRRLLILSVVLAALGAACADDEPPDLNARLKSLKLRDVAFTNAPVTDVAAALSRLSQALDPEGRGVNIALNLKPPSRGAAGDAGAAGAGGAGGADLPLITFHARYISLLEALRIVCQVAGLKMQFHETVVVLVPLDAPDDGIVYRTYDVVPNAIERVQAVERDAGK